MLSQPEEGTPSQSDITPVLGPSDNPAQLETESRTVITKLVHEQREQELRILLSDRLGKGGFAMVYRGEILGRHQPRFVAVKVLTEEEEIDAMLLKRETNTWKTLQNRNVLPYYGVTLEFGVGQFGLVSPFAENGSMMQFIVNNRGIPRMPLLLGVAEGLVYLHRTAKIVHGDLKCANVLISGDKQPKISDFGLSTVVEKGDGETTTGRVRRILTVAFAAPELLRGTAYQYDIETGNLRYPVHDKKLRSKTTQSDIFAFGRLVYEAYAAKSPWHGTDPDRIRTMVVWGVNPPRKVVNPDAMRLSDALWKICKQCWVYFPSRRPTCDKILARLQAVAKLSHSESELNSACWN